jgi:hypothetical protein
MTRVAAELHFFPWISVWEVNGGENGGSEESPDRR